MQNPRAKERWLIKCIRDFSHFSMLQMDYISLGRSMNLFDLCVFPVVDSYLFIFKKYFQDLLVNFPILLNQFDHRYLNEKLFTFSTFLFFFHRITCSSLLWSI